MTEPTPRQGCALRARHGDGRAPREAFTDDVRALTDQIADQTYKPWGGYAPTGELVDQVRQPCCPEWERAHKTGADNECYASLIGYDDAGLPSIGDNFRMRYCPFCGDIKTATGGGDPVS
jgi:hypothetical protein